MTIIVAPRELPEHVVKMIEAVDPSIKLIATKDEAELAAAWPQMEIMLGGKLDKKLLAKCTNLKWLQATSAGVERYLYPEFINSDVMLTNVKGMHGQTITEHVFMMMLTFARNFRKLLQQQQQHQWEVQEVELIYGKELLVIGLGGIGKRVAQLGKAFGMKVSGVDVQETELPYVDKVYPPEQLDKALIEPDFVVLATPLTEQTKKMMSVQQFAVMKNSAIFINISRGKVVDQDALTEALRSNAIAAAGLDVFVEEPLPADSPIWDLNNVIITPHMAGHMPDYIGNAAEIFCDNLRRYLNGEELEHRVNKQVGF